MYTINKEFLWGGSVSAHQTEGGRESKYGMGKTIHDSLPKREGRSDWNVGIDEYHRYKEDIKLFKELGLRAYRFSISWARIFPNGEGEINEKGLEFYHNFIDELILNDIEPIICTYHFDLPLELERKYGGWRSKNTVSAYAEYVELLAKEFKNKVKTWIPMNEQNGCHMPALLYSGLSFKDEEYQIVKTNTIHNIAVACSLCTEIVHKNVPDAKVGAMIQFCPMYAESTDPEDVLAAHQAHNQYNYEIVDTLLRGGYAPKTLQEWEGRGIMPDIEPEELELFKNTRADFVAFSYYFSKVMNKNVLEGDLNDTILKSFMTCIEPFPKNKYLTQTDWGWTIDPMGMRMAMNDLYDRYQLPVFIFESGFGTEEVLNEDNTVDDDNRITYFNDHIREVKKAMEIDKVPCLGYLTWAPIDILSSGAEMKKRYGFIYVNRTDSDLKDLARYKKKSFDWFSNVIKTNAKDIV